MKPEKREEYIWAKYKWEFMRRNPEAIDVLRDLSARTGLRFCDFLLGPAAAELNDNSRKDDFWSPKLTFDEIIGNIRKRDPGVNGKVLVEALIDHGIVKFNLEKSKLNIECDTWQQPGSRQPPRLTAPFCTLSAP